MLIRSPAHTAVMFFFFNDTATTEIYTLSLHDALPISPQSIRWPGAAMKPSSDIARFTTTLPTRASERHRREAPTRSEEHTSELQSRQYLVCRLLLEKKNNQQPEKTRTTA